MRSVLYRVWIPFEYEVGNNRKKEGTERWTDFIYKGLFHQWTTLNDRYGVLKLYAIVEKEDGKIDIVKSDNIKFQN